MLKFTTTTSFYKEDSPAEILATKPLIIPQNDSILHHGRLKGNKAYIVGKALALAGFYLPCFFDGDITDLDKPESRIFMVLPKGTYKVVVKIDRNQNYLLDLE